MVAEVGAVNVSDAVVRAVYRPGAPLAEAGPGSALRVRSLPVSAPCGLAVRGDRLLLLGGYEPGTDHPTRPGAAVHDCRLTDDGAAVVGRGELTFPNGDPVRRHAHPSAGARTSSCAACAPCGCGRC